MGLERRGNGLYFYKKVRIGDRVISQYAGSGMAAIASEGFAQDQAKEAQAVRAQIRTETIEIRDLQRQIAEYSREVDQILSGCLESSGYHRHKRGEWRKKRTDD